MEKQTMNITREELDGFMRQIEGIKSTIEILQDRDLMDNIKESEMNIKSGRVKKLEL